MDERVIPSFEYAEDRINPLLGKRMKLDRDRFLPLMDEYYRVLGWDVACGCPTRERLGSLDLGDVYDEMASGAAKARERLATLPPVQPVADVHEAVADAAEEKYTLV